MARQPQVYARDRTVCPGIIAISSAEVIGAAAGGPPDRAKMMEVFRRHGMTMAAPPHTPAERRVNATPNRRS